MTQLSVNVNKIAVLRNSRGGAEPDVVRAAQACLDAGAHGITVHPRPDRRHITAEDVLALSTLTRARGVEFNIEGNPFAPPREGYRAAAVVRTDPPGAGHAGAGWRWADHVRSRFRLRA